MFSIIYKYWFNQNDTPSILYKLNVWTYINIRFFKFKFSKNILYFIQNLNGLKLSSISFFYNDWDFFNIYKFFLKYFLIVLFILLFL